MNAGAAIPGRDVAGRRAARSIPPDFGPFDAAVMPIGAYDPWIWAHCTPDQAVSMADDAAVRLIVPVHHQSFRLSREPLQEPIERFQRALAREPERLALSEAGETAVIEP